MKKITAIFPILILFSLLIFLGYELFHVNYEQLPSPLTGNNVPQFTIPSLTANKNFSSSILKDRVSLLNVWATWCESCTIEHDMLLKIQRDYHIPIYGLLYKDNKQKAIAFLNQHGDPYMMIGDDSKGDVAIDLGIYGTPETFIISSSGKIVYRHIGVIDQETWDKILSPMINQLEKTNA